MHRSKSTSMNSSCTYEAEVLKVSCTVRTHTHKESRVGRPHLGPT